MQNSNRIWATLIAVVIVVLIAVALIQRPAAAPTTSTTTSTDLITTSQAAASTTHDGIQGTGNFTVETDKDTVELNIPDFRTPIQFSPNTSADVKAALQKAASGIADRLAKDSLNLESWIDLGAVRKIGGDYEGAATAWKFVTQAAPTNTIAWNNLGDLYMNFSKDYPKAENAYLTSIKLAPHEENPYHELFNLYNELYKKSPTAAEDILKKGTAANPDSIDLHVLLARYYKSAGRTGDAKTQYEAAISAATKSGQSTAAEQLKVEENQ